MLRVVNWIITASAGDSRFYLKIVTPHYSFNLIRFSYHLSWEYLFVSETMDVRELVHLAAATTINTKHSLKASLCFGDVSLKA